MSYLSAIGLMSGTSYDGVDVALLNTDGESVGRLGPTGYRGYSDAERAVLRRAIAAAGNLGNRDARPEALAEAEALLTAVHAEAVESYLAANGLNASDVAVVGFHGQTVLHQPDRHLTVQLGDGAALARRLGIPVVYDFRAADIAAGGRARRWCRSIIAPWCGCSTGRSRSACSTSAASPTSLMSTARNSWRSTSARAMR